MDVTWFIIYAVVGMVDITVAAKIIPGESGHFVLHTDTGREEFDTEEEAVSKGRQHLEKLARKRMVQDHVIGPLLDFGVDHRKATTKSGEDIYLETELRLRETGRPNVMEQGHMSNQLCDGKAGT